MEYDYMDVFRNFAKIEITVPVSAQKDPFNPKFVEMLKIFHHSSFSANHVTEATLANRQLVRVKQAHPDNDNNKRLVLAIDAELKANIGLADAKKAARYLSGFFKQAPVRFDYDGATITVNPNRGAPRRNKISAPVASRTPTDTP